MPAKNNSAASKKPRKTVNAKHKIEFTAPTIVDDPSIVDPEEEAGEVEGEGEGEGVIFFGDDDEEVAVRRPPTLKQRLRSKFEKRGIGGTEIMTLRIDRLPSFQQDGLAGVRADKEFCGMISCTEDIFDGDDYLTRIQQSYGPGAYWLTLRHKNSIVQTWREIIAGAAPPIGENGQHQPTIIYNQPPHQTAGPPPDPLTQLRGAFRIVKEFREDLGLVMPATAATQAPPPAPLDPEVVLLQGLASNDKFMDKIQTGTIRKLFGDKAADDEPSFAAVAMEMVKTGQADRAITALGNIALRLVDRIIPNFGNQNGHAQMAQTQVQDQAPANAGQQDIPLPSVQGGPHAGQIAQGDGGAAGRQMDGANTSPNAAAYQNMPPPQQALMILLEDCRMSLPYQIAYDKLMDLAEAIYDQAPAYSIYPYLAYFGDMTIDDALEFVKTQPGGEEVAALPHARAWTENIQRLIKESRQEDDEA